MNTIDLLNNMLGNFSATNKLPKSIFMFGGLRDDAYGEYSSWRQENILKAFSTPGAAAKIYGYKLYSGYWQNAALVKSGNSNDFVIGRIVKYNESNKILHASFKEVLSKINEYHHESAFQVVINAFLESDDSKSNPIPVIIYETAFNEEIDKEFSLIISNDWMKHNVLKSEIKSSTNNRVRSSKGGARLISKGARKHFVEWAPNVTYNKDDIICVDPKKRYYGNYIANFKFWAMCMKQHKSDETNKPQKGQIFADLLLNVIPFIRIYLIEHVEGFNNELSTIIIDYCYVTNEYWWNGCAPQSELYADKKAQKLYTKHCICGNLVAGIFCATHCKKCKVIADQGSDSKIATKIANIGCVITLSKTDKTVWREYKDDNGDDELTDKGNIILRRNIESNEERQKICNLMERNFNEAMSPLIRACINEEESFIYKYHDDDIKVDIGKTNIWALYNINDATSGNDEELLCALIWRWVHGERGGRSNARLMFEVLFLSTYENARFNNYGQKMVKEIELYCIANNYDLMSVAAVPVHGEAFWKSNGFKERKDVWLRQNMLVFDDTPLFAKYL